MTNTNKMVVREVSDDTKINFLILEDERYIILIQYQNEIYEYSTDIDISYGFDLYDLLGDLLSLWKIEKDSEKLKTFIDNFTKPSKSYQFILSNVIMYHQGGIE